MTPPPLTPNSAPHPVARKLRHNVLPWLESAKLLKQQWFYRLHLMFGYATDITVGLAAIGISIPLLAALTQSSEDGATKPNIPSLLSADPPWLYYLGLACVIVWIVLRVTYNREDGQKRAVLARSCTQTMRQAEARLYNMLSDPDPMPELNKMIQEQINPTVDRHIQEGAWPWNGPSPDVEPAVEKRLVSLREKFEAGWTPVDPGGLRS